jgi:hypothetical protein
MNRRTLLGTVAAGGVMLGTAGCLDIAFGDEVEFTANPAVPGSATVSETGFELASSENLQVKETIEAAGQSRTIIANSQVRVYQRSVTLDGSELKGALFAVASLPAVTVAGRTFNPISQLSHEELLTRFGAELSGQYESLQNAEFQGESQETIFGQETTVSEFLTTTTLQELQGREVDITLYVATIEHEDDLIVTVGAHPARLPEERANIIDLKRSLEHPIES